MPQEKRLNLSLNAADGGLVDRIGRLLYVPKVPSQPPARLRTSWGTLMIVLLGCTMIMGACNPVDESEDFGPPEQFFVIAKEAIEEGDFTRVEAVTERAAEAGNVCAMTMVSEIYRPKFRLEMAQKQNPASFVLETTDWFGAKEERARFWRNVLADSLQQQAERGEAGAALWLGRLLDPDMGFLWNDDALPENDSLSNYWYQEAIRLGDPEALFNEGLRSENREDKRQFYEQAARQGYKRAYERWAVLLLNGEDGPAYLRVADEALDAGAEAVHEWLARDLEALARQAETGDAVALEWKSMADSLGLYERLAVLPEYTKPKYDTNSWLCSKEFSYLDDNE